MKQNKRLLAKPMNRRMLALAMKVRYQSHHRILFSVCSMQAVTAMSFIRRHSLQYKELASLHNLLWWLSLLNGAPPDDGVVIWVRDPYNSFMQ